MIFICNNNDEIEDSKLSIQKTIKNVQNLREFIELSELQAKLIEFPNLYDLFMNRYFFIKSRINKLSKPNNKSLNELILLCMGNISYGIKKKYELIKELYNDMINFINNLKKNEQKVVINVLKELCISNSSYQEQYLNKLIDFLFKNMNTQNINYLIFQKITISPYTIPNQIKYNLIELPIMPTDNAIIEQLDDAINNNNYLSVINIIKYLNFMDEMWIGDYNGIWVRFAEFMKKNEEIIDLYDMLLIFFEILKYSQIDLNLFKCRNTIIATAINNIIEANQNENDQDEE
jgi:hypothetical protein